jgi:hypothetical protein
MVARMAASMDPATVAWCEAAADEASESGLDLGDDDGDEEEGEGDECDSESGSSGDDDNDDGRAEETPRATAGTEEFEEVD